MKLLEAVVAGIVSMVLVTSGAYATGKTEQARAAKTTTEKAKTAVSDTWITSKAKIALFADERIKSPQVSVKTSKGVLQLHGKVDSPEAKEAATEVTKTLDGVKTVKNELKVVPPAARKVVDATDKDITKVVETKLAAADASLKKASVRTDAGVVTLTGEVPSITKAAKASEVARLVPGVKAVKNELALKE